MGFNTACIILNDRLHDLPKRDDLGSRIQTSVLTASRRHSIAPGMDFLPSQHADTVQIVAVGGNRIFSLGYGHWRDEPEDLLRKLADQMGFRIVRKPRRAA